MTLAAVEEDIFKGKDCVHSLTFHESQKRRWGICLLEASRLLQGVHQSVRQKWKKHYSQMWCPSSKNPYQAMAVLVQVSRTPGRSHSVLGWGREDGCWVFRQAGHTKSAYDRTTTGRQQKTKEQTKSLNDFMGIIIHKGSKIKSA